MCIYRVRTSTHGKDCNSRENIYRIHSETQNGLHLDTLKSNLFVGIT